MAKFTRAKSFKACYNNHAIQQPIVARQQWHRYFFSKGLYLMYDKRPNNPNPVDKTKKKAAVDDEAENKTQMQGGKPRI